MSIISSLKARYAHLQEEAKKFIAPDELQKTRIEICNSCEHLFTPTRNCKSCGCFVDIKTKFLTVKCPENKW